MNLKKINYHVPYLTGDEITNIKKVFKKKIFSNENYFSRNCENYISKKINSNSCYLTPSCTAALEIAAILLDLKKNDEIIMPSFTFVSTANAFTLRGARPVFVDIRKDTLNINEKNIENSITKKTKAIVVVHYAGVACEIEKILKICKKHGLILIEDAAHAFDSKYKNKNLGSYGDIACFSFHETKNIISGVGGAIVINKRKYKSRLEVIRQKGTNRNQFLDGKANKYVWQDVGSSYVPGELTAAFLWGQLKNSKKILNLRMKLWNNYHNLCNKLENKGKVTRPFVPAKCNHNAHIYFLILKNKKTRNGLIKNLKSNNIQLTTHYEPLHLSPAAKKFFKKKQNLPVTSDISNSIIRLPLWIGLTKKDQFTIVRLISNYLDK